MSNAEINPNYHVPQGFFEIIEPYIKNDERQTIGSVDELVKVWQAALAAYSERPDYAEHIAEWTMSAAATSPLLTDPQLEEIHVLFGDAEIDTDEKEELWRHIGSLVADLTKQNK